MQNQFRFLFVKQGIFSLAADM